MTEKEEQKRLPDPSSRDTAGEPETDKEKAEKNETASAESFEEPVKTEDHAGEKSESDKLTSPAETPAEEPSPTVTKPRRSRKTKPASGSEPPESSSRVSFYFLLILIAALCGVLVYGAYWFWDHYNSSEQSRTSSIDELRQQIESQQQSLAAIENSQDRIANNLRQQLSQTQQRLQAAEQRLAAQNKRLLSMSTVSREDWQLAEAEYLLKLANQRVLIERSAEGADALLSEADVILRDLADPDLFPLRQAIADDLAQLRLVREIDVEGIYLALQALASRVDDLPIRPTREQLLGEDAEKESVSGEEQNRAEEGWWSGLKNSFSRFIGDTDRYIRVRDHSVKPRPMLPPDSEEYLQQNLRLILQRAQLALLREQQKIYTGSLEQAREWVTQYYPPSEEAQKFRRQIEELKSREIVRELPDITQSLELVHAYIDKLHRLDGVEPSVDHSGEQQ